MDYNKQNSSSKTLQFNLTQNCDLKRMFFAKILTVPSWREAAFMLAAVSTAN